MEYDVVVRNGVAIDDSGAPRYRADVAIKDRKMAALIDPGDAASAYAAREIDAAGLVIAPGFMDLHSHSDWVLPIADHGKDPLKQHPRKVAREQRDRATSIGIREAWGDPYLCPKGLQDFIFESNLDEVFWAAQDLASRSSPLIPDDGAAWWRAHRGEERHDGNEHVESATLPKEQGAADTSSSEDEVMATEKQIAANRKNAARSTGPRTGAGTTRSAMNSARHGWVTWAIPFN